jgi:hypothetical protein
VQCDTVITLDQTLEGYISKDIYIQYPIQKSRKRIFSYPFLPALVRMYNAGLSFALFLFLGSQSLLKILHYCPISPCIQQPCPAALHSRLARQFDKCRPNLMRALARSAVTPLLQWQVTKLHACAAVRTGLSLFLVQFHHAFINCMRALLSSRQV